VFSVLDGVRPDLTFPAPLQGILRAPADCRRCSRLAPRTTAGLGAAARAPGRTKSGRSVGKAAWTPIKRFAARLSRLHFFISSGLPRTDDFRSKTGR
jgi:hypothetical protein